MGSVRIVDNRAGEKEKTRNFSDMNSAERYEFIGEINKNLPADMQLNRGRIEMVKTKHEVISSGIGTAAAGRYYLHCKTQ